MDWSRAHCGDINQKTGLPNAGLRAYVTSSPADMPETQLHGDVDGSPFSSNPGALSLEEAREQATAPADKPAKKKK